MSEWKTTELGNVITLKRGYDLPQQKRKSGLIPIFSSSGVSGSHNTAMVKAPGVITGRYGTIGQVFYADTDFWPLNTTLYVENFHGNDPLFIYFFLKTLAWEKFTSASAVPGINRNAVHKEIVRIPDVETQKAIAKYLLMIDEKIKNNEQINDNLLEQLNALYQELSTRDEWDIMAIGELADKIAMGPFGSNIKVSTFVPYGVPIISGNHLRGYFLEEPSYNYITEKHAEKLKNSIVYPGDIIFTHAGNIGQVAMIPDACDYPRYVLSQRQFYLRCNIEKILPEYVTLFFHSKEGQHKLLSYANQTGVPSLAQPASNLKKITLPVPPIQTQEEWAALVRPIIAQYQHNRLESCALADLRDALLPKLMSGEIDVSSIDR